MLSKLILFLSSVLVLFVIFDRIQNNIVFTLYFKYEVKEGDVTEKLLFRDYLKKFNKSYERDESQMRHHLFKENLLKIDRLNRESRHATYGVTKFSDWTEEELAAILLPNVGMCAPIFMPYCGADRIRRSAEKKTKKNKDRMDCCKKRRSRHSLYNVTVPRLWWKGKSAKLQIDEECKCGSRRSRVASKQRIKKPLPSKVDWREHHAVGPVLDQKRCPACWAFSIIGVMESRALIQNYGFNRLSIQQLLDCSFSRGKNQTGCHSGRPVVEALMCLCDEQLKITSEAKYPLTLVEEKCRRTSPGGRGIKRFVNSCNMYEDETKLLEVLSEGPVTALVNGNFFFNYHDGIIAENCETTENKLNHAVQLVGYDLTGNTSYYILKNSWGTDWGEGGYARLAVGKNQCGVAYSIAYFDVN